MLTLKDKKEIYQWDSGVKLNINSPCTEVHFSNVLYGDAITVLVKGNEVEIPNELLTKAESFFCWCYVSDNQGGYTIAQKRFNVKQRPKPTGYIYTPSEKATVEQLAKDAVDKALESGMKGENVYIRYSAYADGTDFTEEWSDGQDYIGISVSEKEAPADKREYEWSLFSLMGEGKKEITDYIDKEIAEFDFVKVVDVLPKEGLPNREYFVRKDSLDTNDLFDEYAWINKGTEEEPDWDWEFKGTKTMEIDLAEYVKKTDYATKENGGVIRYDVSFGFRVDGWGRGAIVPATLNEIGSKSNEFKPIVPATLDYAVIQALTENRNSLDSKEKDAISEWLGVDERHVLKSVDGETGEESIDLGGVSVSETTLANLLEMLENMGDIESALDIIISEQEAIIEIQNALIGGAS